MSRNLLDFYRPLPGRKLVNRYTDDQLGYEVATEVRNGGSDMPNGGNTIIAALRAGGLSEPAYITLRKPSATHKLELVRGSGELIMAADRDHQTEVNSLDLGAHLRPHDMYFVHNNSKRPLIYRQIARPALRDLQVVPLLSATARQESSPQLEAETLVEVFGGRQFFIPLPMEFVEAFNIRAREL
jgi:hypothetical protein